MSARFSLFKFVKQPENCFKNSTREFTNERVSYPRYDISTRSFRTGIRAVLGDRLKHTRFPRNIVRHYTKRPLALLQIITPVMVM